MSLLPIVGYDLVHKYARAVRVLLVVVVGSSGRAGRESVTLSPPAGGYVPTTVSDWGDWLPRAVEPTDPGTVAIWYLGCSGFVIKGSEGTTLFVGPYVGIGDPPRTVRMIPALFDSEDVIETDVVLATHGHTDHVHGQGQAPTLENTDATFVAPDDSFSVAYDNEAWFDDCDLSEDQFEEIARGDSVGIGELTVHAEPTYDPDMLHPVAYVLEHKSGAFIHGGDTKPAEEFADIGERYDLDLGIFALGTVGNIPDKKTGEPVRTTWHNDENQIIEAASDLDLDRLVPTHWDMWKGMAVDPKVLYHHVKSFEVPRSLDLVETGDRIDL